MCVGERQGDAATKYTFKPLGNFSAVGNTLVVHIFIQFKRCGVGGFACYMFAPLPASQTTMGGGDVGRLGPTALVFKPVTVGGPGAAAAFSSVCALGFLSLRSNFFMPP